MTLDMEKMVMMQLDTYDTLKYGHIPLNNLIEYAMSKNIDFSNFEYDDEILKYRNQISLYFNGDFYYIDLFISQPGFDDGEDVHTTVAVHFYFGVHIDNEERRNYPHMTYNNQEYFINSRKQFVEVLEYDWKLFVHNSIGEILCHKLAILDNLDDIVKVENELTQYKSNKNDYVKVLDKVTNHVTNNIQNMILYKKVTDWCE